MIFELDCKRGGFELPRPGHAVVSGTLFSAPRASGLGVGSRDDLGDDPLLVALIRHSNRMVNEALEAVDFVE